MRKTTSDDSPWMGCAACVAVLLLIFGGCAATHDTVYSTGQRDGIVQKIGDTGWPWATTEGQLAMRGLRLKNGGGGDVFHFSVTSRGVADRMSALPPDTPVRLKYVQYWWRWPWVARTCYIVTDVETP